MHANLQLLKLKVSNSHSLMNRTPQLLAIVKKNNMDFKVYTNEGERHQIRYWVLNDKVKNVETGGGKVKVIILITYFNWVYFIQFISIYIYFNLYQFIYTSIYINSIDIQFIYTAIKESKFRKVSES